MFACPRAQTSPLYQAVTTNRENGPNTTSASQAKCEKEPTNLPNFDLTMNTVPLLLGLLKSGTFSVATRHKELPLKNVEKQTSDPIRNRFRLAFLQPMKTSPLYGGSHCVGCYCEKFRRVK